jgi:5'-3' exonuclease
MIIFDFNQVAISNLMEQIGSSPKTKVEESLVRHMILNTIRTYVKKFKSEYGPTIVIACDNRHYWRREVFPNYKSNRKKNRESSGFDWQTIFECLNKIRQELKDNSPYHVIDVHGAEADDIIATLCMRYASQEKIMILSSDKDFAQLQSFTNVSQYSPIMKKHIKEPLPNMHLKQLIIRGDKGDAIPNILSADNVIVDGIRQKPISEAKIINWINQRPEEFCTEEMLRNYKRNEILIDLSQIPQNIRANIVTTYEESKPNTKQQFMNYMIEKRLKNLLEIIDEF